MKYDIVITGIQAWDIEIGSNCKNLALEMSKTNRVLYVNPPLDRFTRWLKLGEEKIEKRVQVINGKRSPFEQINDNLVVYTPETIIESINKLPTNLFKRMNKMNNQRFAKSIRKAMDHLSIVDFILFSDSDMFRSYHLKELLKPKSFLYYTRDNLMTVPYWQKHGEELEPEIMKKADAVVCNSPELQKQAVRLNQKAYYVGQGCSIDHYLPENNYLEPEDLHRIKGIRVGYTGVLSSRRLSINLIKGIAEKNKDWNIVLVGPEEDCFKESELHAIENVHFLGAKKPEELPAYVQHFDVCINPQVDNELTRSNYPRKIDEYLAAGKAVVATYTPTMEVFEGYCHLANSVDSFIEGISDGLKKFAKKYVDKRVAYASSHSWQNNVKEIFSVVNVKA